MRPLPICHLTIGPDCWAVGIDNNGDTTGWSESPAPRPCLGSRCSAWAAGDYRSPDMGSCGLVAPGEAGMWQDPASKAADPGLAEAGAMVEAVLDMDVCELAVSTRAYNVIVDSMSRRPDGEWRNPTLRELCACTYLDLLRLPGCGTRTIEEIERALAEHGLRLREYGEARP